MSFSGVGSGSIGDPYIITDAYELNELRSISTPQNYSVFYAELANDIEMNVAPYNVGEGWDPLMSVGRDEFKGIIDGKGYRIKNLYINRPTEDGVGLIKNIGNVAISEYIRTSCNNILFENANIIGQDDVGVLTGINSNNTINKCGVVSGSVSGRHRVGGLVGVNFHSPSDIGNGHVGEIYNCFSRVNVSGETMVGGLVGRSDIVASVENSVTQTLIVNSYSTGLVSGTSDVGGFLGKELVVFLYSPWNIGNTHVSVDCVWDMESSGVSTSSSIEVGYTTSEMKSFSTFSNWDIARVEDLGEQTWFILSRVDYPMLSVFQVQSINNNVSYDDSILNGSMFYNGTDAFSILPKLNIDKDSSFTLSMWIYPETPDEIASLQEELSLLGNFQLDVDYPGNFFPDNYIFNRGINSPSISINGMGVGGSSELTTVKFKIGDVEVDVFSNQVMNQSPYMLTLVYNKGMFKGYVNMTESDTGYNKIDSGDFQMSLARPPTDILQDGTFFKGYISRIGFWENKAFTYNDVVKLFNRADILPFHKFIIDNHVIRGVVDDISYNYNDVNGFHLELDGRVNPELVDKTITTTFIANTGDEAIHKILEQYKDDIVIEFWNGKVWVSAVFNEELGVLEWGGDINNFPTTLINLSSQDEKGWSVIRRICDILSLDCYVTYDTVRDKWVLRLFTINSVGNDSSKELFHFKLNADFLDKSFNNTGVSVTNVNIVGGTRDSRASFDDHSSKIVIDSPSKLFEDYVFSFSFEVTDSDTAEMSIVDKQDMFTVKCKSKNGSYDIIVIMDNKSYVINNVDVFMVLNNIILERTITAEVVIHRVFLNNKLVASGSINDSEVVTNDSSIVFNPGKDGVMIFPITESEEPIRSINGDYTMILNDPSATITTDGLNTNAINVDGSNSGVQSIIIDNSGDLIEKNDEGVLSFFVKFDGENFVDNKTVFRTNSSPTGPGWHITTSVWGSDKELNIRYRFPGGSYQGYRIIQPDVWHHILITYKKGTNNTQFFLNGTRRITIPREIDVTGENWIFGDCAMDVDEVQFYPQWVAAIDPFVDLLYNNGNGGYFEISTFLGNILDVRMYNSKLSPEERFKIFNNGFGNRSGVVESMNNITQGVNVININDFRENNADVINRVKVYGQDINNLFFLHTAEDVGSQDLTWVKDRIIADNTLLSNSDVRDRAVLELDKLKIKRISGTVTAVGLPSISPGEVIDIAIPNCNANNLFRVHDITHNIGTEFTTNISVASKIDSLNDIFVGRFNPDELMNLGNNVNNMKYAFNVFFNEVPSVMTHVGTSEFNGRLRINAEMTNGQSTSKFLEMPENIQFCELRRIENYHTDGDVYEVTNNGGLTWETLTPIVAEGVTAFGIHQFTSVGNKVGFRITMNRDSVNEPTPMYDGISLLCK